MGLARAPETEESVGIDSVAETMSVSSAAISESTHLAQRKAGKARLSTKGKGQTLSARGSVSLHGVVDRILRVLLPTLHVGCEGTADENDGKKSVRLASAAKSLLVRALEGRVARVSRDAAEAMKRHKPPQKTLNVSLWRVAEARGDPRDEESTIAELNKRDGLCPGGTDLLKKIGNKPIHNLVAQSGIKVSAKAVIEVQQMLTEDVYRLLLKALALTELRKGRHNGGRRIDVADAHYAIALRRPEGYGVTEF